MTRTSKRTPKKAAKPGKAPTTATDDIRALRGRLREEKLVIKLAGQLERHIRRTDLRLLELGGALMGRSANLSRASERRIERAKAQADASDVSPES